MNENEKLKPCPFCGGEMEPTVMCYQHPYDQTMKAGGGSPLRMHGLSGKRVIKEIRLLSGLIER